LGIEDQHHRTVAQDGGAGEGGDVPKQLRQRLDHDLLGVEHVVDSHAELAAAHLHHDHELGLAGRSAFSPRKAGEVDQRQQAVAQAQHTGVVDRLDAVLGVPAGAHQLAHAELRDGEALAARPDDHRGDDRQRQRDLDGEGGAAPLDGDQVHLAADLLDVGADHVHADTAAGEVCDRLRGGEARCEDEAVNLGVGQARHVSRADQALGDGLVPDARGVQP
jgi:hypothetical protein